MCNPPRRFVFTAGMVGHLALDMVAMAVRVADEKTMFLCESKQICWLVNRDLDIDYPKYRDAQISR